MYKVLYRKWRPKNFADVIGQGHVTSVLKNEIVEKKISHSYMFVGTRGSGKTTCARIFAKAVNCISPINSGEPCLKCKACEAIDNNTTDMIEIDAASNNGVENIRAIKEESNFATSILNYRVYIIDEFHMLSIGAFNAFLKILEEPPCNLIFILATTEFHKIPKTVVSRCQKFDFFKIPVGKLFEYLKKISSSENINITDDALSIIANIADGSARDALTILERFLSCQNKVIDADKVNLLMGLTDSKDIENLACLISNRDIKSCLEKIENLNIRSKNMAKICEGLIGFFRAVMLYKITGKYFDYYHHECDVLKEISKLLSEENIMKIFDVLKNAYNQMNKIYKPEIELEFAFIKIYQKIKPNNSQINDTEIPSAKSTKDDEKSEIKNNEKPETGDNKKPKIKNENKDKFDPKIWNSILEKLNDVSDSYLLTLKGSYAYVENNFLVVVVSKKIYVDILKRSLPELKEIIFDFIGENYKIKFVSKEEDSKKENNNLDELINDAENMGIKIY
ncbi:MAG: DNA polymerase III subunit gamma/tau [Candidatus Improbicoccus pseudotrichonymphae]|uniref:DNA-directed DNA polymerase n=1 Tax=Candidatus Improbicoccus pseudotrichonymphae TaxID=3033792 RepID=A0AA48I9X0_9FIRM|nr:MAG: DNA polymerase III subunit gamma/tau [Candidatus Improbicoccus pseudotrichonymphae]